jgi:hypothetical protein
VHGCNKEHHKAKEPRYEVDETLGLLLNDPFMFFSFLFSHMKTCHITLVSKLRFQDLKTINANQLRIGFFITVLYSTRYRSNWNEVNRESDTIVEGLEKHYLNLFL